MMGCLYSAINSTCFLTLLNDHQIITYHWYVLKNNCITVLNDHNFDLMLIYKHQCLYFNNIRGRLNSDPFIDHDFFRDNAINSDDPVVSISILKLKFI